jgi:hypothetical protein
MDKACSMYRRGVHTRYWLAKLKQRDHSEDQDIGGRILRWMREMGWVGFGLDSSGLGQGPVVGCCNAVMNFWVP